MRRLHQNKQTLSIYYTHHSSLAHGNNTNTLFHSTLHFPLYVRLKKHRLVTNERHTNISNETRVRKSLNFVFKKTLQGCTAARWCVLQPNEYFVLLLYIIFVITNAFLRKEKVELWKLIPNKQTKNNNATCILLLLPTKQRHLYLKYLRTESCHKLIIICITLFGNRTCYKVRTLFIAIRLTFYCSNSICILLLQSWVDSEL